MIFHVTLEQDEDGWIVVECPALPGCVSQGRDEKEALENIKEAITAWLWAEDQKALTVTPAKTGPMSHCGFGLTYGKTCQYFRQGSRQGL